MCRVRVAVHVLLLFASACVDLTPPQAFVDGGIDADTESAAPGDAPDETVADGSDGEAPDARLDMAQGWDRPADLLPDVPPADVSGGEPDMPPSTLGDGLVGYWKLDDRSMALVADSSSNGNNGTVMGAPALLTSGLPPLNFTDPGAFSFTGMNDAVVVPDSASLRPAKLTVAVWVKLASQSARGTNCGSADPMLQYIVHRRNTRGADGNFEGIALMKEKQGTFAFLLSTNAGVQDYARSLTVSTVGSWFHLVGTFDGSVIQLYVNGMLEATKSHASPIDYDPTRPLFVARTGECFFPNGEGDATWDARFNGALDDLRIYGRVLTVDEVTRLAAGRDQ